MATKANVIDFDQADPEIQALARDSAEARKAAYCPFSKFAVGAALKSVDGTVLLGCNVENSSYGAGICAERTACTKAVSSGHKEFTAIAICADTANNEITTPCGICRQFLFEFSNDLPIYCVTSDMKRILITTIDELLPYGFRLNALPPHKSKADNNPNNCIKTNNCTKGLMETKPNSRNKTCTCKISK